MEKYQAIQEFIERAVKNEAIEELDMIYLRNQLLHFLGFNDWEIPEATDRPVSSLELMDELMKIARENQTIPEGEEEFYEATLMDFITPSPTQINQNFWKKYRKDKKEATDYFYQLAREINQVKTRDIAKNIAFTHHSIYGDLEITINLSKPEKDPKAIAAAKLKPSSAYPSCALCLENEGLYGGGNQPARSNHRIVRLSLNDEAWGFQYSPYAYYNEHSILLNQKHQPMKITAHTFENLLAFLDLFPHYMIGSNADLPIVGGSILTHDHYQAGCHEFPMMKAKIKKKIQLKAFPEVSAGIVDWPMSVLRLEGRDREKMVDAARHTLEKWQTYTDETLSIRAKSSDGTPHHTITPIASKKEDRYILDLVLRDNNVSETYPDGIFHPHQELHHIKKENIGLIEVMGLAVLPPRLKNELKEVEKYLLDEPNKIKAIHLPWAEKLKEQIEISPENVESQVCTSVGEVFVQVLQDAGVFKDTTKGQAGFIRFIDFLNQ